MSLVKIQSNASGTGTLTIAAPNTNTDSTLTLPDATGTLINTAPGTAGNVLTSNGTAWLSQAAASGGVTDLDVIGAITVGYYGITNPTTTSGRHSFLSRGATLAGSSIRIGNATTANNSTQSNNGNIPFEQISNSTTTFPTTQTTTLSGTWRNIGGTLWSTIIVSGCTTTYRWYPMLWVRIS